MSQQFVADVTYNPFEKSSADILTAHGDFDVVIEAAGTQSAIEHLVREHNHKRLAFIRGPAANMEAEARQPLLQGGGVQFNRIAGPNAVPGFPSNRYQYPLCRLCQWWTLEIND